MQCGVAMVANGMNICAFFNQELTNLSLSMLRCKVQWRYPKIALGMDNCAVFKQNPTRLQGAVTRCAVQWTPLPTILRINIDTLINQYLTKQRMPKFSGVMQYC